MDHNDVTVCLRPLGNEVWEPVPKGALTSLEHSRKLLSVLQRCSGLDGGVFLLVDTVPERLDFKSIPPKYFFRCKNERNGHFLI